MTASRSLRRPDLADLQPFPASTPPPDAVRLNANELAFPPFPAALEAIAAAAPTANRYPDNHASQLIGALSRRLELAPTHITAAPGSVTLCLQAAQATCGPGDQIVFPWPSFEAYPLIARIVGADPRPVDLDPQLRPDLDAMAAAVDKHTRLVFLCTPNNPTGPVLGADAVEAFLDRIPSDVLVVIDEAYIEFVRDPTALDGLELLRTRVDELHNVAILRTFSKAYGLAGLRVGYAAAPPDVISLLSCVSLPYAVNAVAQRAALASLEDRDELQRRCERVAGQRRRVVNRLRSLGLTCPDTEANFVWVHLPQDADALAQHCAQHGVLVRSIRGHGVRITIGRPEDDDRAVRCAESYVAGSPLHD